MKYVSSRDNPIYKSVLKLTRKKYRDENGMYLLEGIKPLKDALTLGMEIEMIFADDSVQAAVDFAERESAGMQVQTIMLQHGLFEALSDTESSQGVIAVLRRRSFSEEEFFGQDGSNVLILDRLQDVGNIGTIIRTAEAAGFSGVGVIKGTGDIYSPKVVRAAAGSLMRMPVMFFESPEKVAEAVHGAGKKLVVSCLEDSVNCFDADIAENAAIVIGNEGRGVSRELMDLADIKVRIPMKGSIESLNAAVAAGILMYAGMK